MSLIKATFRNVTENLHALEEEMDSLRADLEGIDLDGDDAEFLVREIRLALMALLQEHNKVIANQINILNR